MTNMNKDLMKEHQLILQYIELLISASRKQTGMEQDRVLQISHHFIDFIQNFADKFHHAKEEDILFKYLSVPGVLTHCNPVQQMLYEHDQGRHYLQGMIQAIDKNNFVEFAENAQAYGKLLQEHIYKEDNILYPMAEQSLSIVTKEKIVKEFEATDHRLEAQAVWKRYQEIVNELSRALI